MKKLFFIIPVYKVEDYLRRCVDSVLSQTYENIEIILVDDGSPDNCPTICDEYASKYTNIKVIHKQNGGLSDARNAGITYIKDIAKEDDYITFLDSDDFVHSQYAEKMIALCEENSCEVAQCGYEKGNKDSFSDNFATPQVFYTNSENALLGYTLKSQCCAKIYSFRVFSELFFPTGVLNEDEFVTYRAVFNAKNIVFTDENLYYYYQHGTSIMVEIAKKLKDNPHRKDYLKAYAERIEFFEKAQKPEQVLKTREKICTDIILRYCEQMYLAKADRDEDCTSGEYIRIYKENFKTMIKRNNIPLKRKLMYIAFYILPYSAVLMGKFFKLRK